MSQGTIEKGVMHCQYNFQTIRDANIKHTKNVDQIAKKKF
jgi:hypothetical protein